MPAVLEENMAITHVDELRTTLVTGQNSVGKGIGIGLTALFCPVVKDAFQTQTLWSKETVEMVVPWVITCRTSRVWKPIRSLEKT